MHHSYSSNFKKLFGLLISTVFFLSTLLLSPPSNMSIDAWRVAGLMGLMATWWILEIIPIPMTALLPIVIGPMLGILPLKEVTAPYAHPIIFLFIGGYILLSHHISHVFAAAFVHG